MLDKSELPPFYPDSIELTCNIGQDRLEHCASSLDDSSMPNCTDDLNYQYPIGWIDANSEHPFTGRCVNYHDNGRILERADFVQGIRIGLWVGFNEDGMKDHQSYWLENHRLRETIWYPNGQTQRQTHYRVAPDDRGRSVRHGLNTIWTENGAIESKICWKNGLKVAIAAEECLFD